MDHNFVIPTPSKNPPEIGLFASAKPYDSRLNTVQYFGFFSKETIEQNAGKLLMLDIDFGRDCSLKCPTCFRQRNRVDDNSEADLTYEELVDLISQARGLGLKEVKICGAGEPFEDSELLKFARQLTDWELGLSIFTKGHVLGDDDLARQFFGAEGIKNSTHLVSALFELNTSILIGCQSFDSRIQDSVVGNVKGYTLRRNKAAESLAKAGFNKCLPTRMAFCALPIVKQTFAGLFDIYVYCRERNLFPLIAPMMTSGKQFRDRFIALNDVPAKEKIDLYSRIYEYNLTHRIQSFETIVSEGVSPMAGVHPCNQIATGLYVTANGRVLSCPGDGSGGCGNVKTSKLEEIWFNSDNFRRRGRFNCACPPKDGMTLPSGFYQSVQQRLEACLEA